MNWKAYKAYNFNNHIKTEGLLEIAGNYVHFKCGNISETVQDMDVTYYSPLIVSDSSSPNDLE